jgi:hypothetical protein
MVILYNLFLAKINVNIEFSATLFLSQEELYDFERLIDD